MWRRLGSARARNVAIIAASNMPERIYSCQGIFSEENVIGNARWLDGWRAVLIRVVGVRGFEASAGEEPAEGVFAARAALGTGDETVAVHHDINGVDSGGIHGGEIGVFHEDDFAVARVLVEILLDGPLGFTDVDGEKDQALVGELAANFVHEGGFVGTVAAPGGPEFEEHDFALNGVVGEFFTGGRDGVEARGGFLVLGTGKCAQGREEQNAGKGCVPEASSTLHAGKCTTRWQTMEVAASTTRRLPCRIGDCVSFRASRRSGRFSCQTLPCSRQ